MTGPDPSLLDLVARARRWAEIDLEHGDEVRALVARVDRGDAEPGADAVARLRSMFDGRIAFGTAGLRAAMAPGPKRMNRLVVQQTTAGLMDWLTDGPTVVIGYDARRNSERYAHDAASVVISRGGTALVVDRPAPTPVLARAVLDRAADAGIMITASHNPPDDNGYKLYLADGIQLVDPADAEIAAAIDRVADRPVLDREEWDRPRSPAVVDIGGEALVAHRGAAVDALVTGHREVSVLYTALHGVGGDHLLDCFRAAGFPTPAVVGEQFAPDPSFPTAPFPNPEEPGAMALALDRAADGPTPVDVVLANDPDADRLAVALSDRSGRWRRLSGDEVGALLADHVLRNRSPGSSPSAPDPADGPDANSTDGAPAVVASSIVSSRFIDTLAPAHGVESVRTLTGFKWVARPIVDRPDARYLFGYEEALGYCIGTGVRDKDGISAAMVMAELVADCRAGGITVLDRLDRLIEEHGLFATAQVTVGFGQRPEIEQEEIRQTAVELAPEELAGVQVVDREDLSHGRTLPPTSGVVLGLADGSRVIVRPSGTEPKVKAYLEVVCEPGNAKEARHDAELRLDRLSGAVTGLLDRPAGP